MAAGLSSPARFFLPEDFNIVPNQHPQLPFKTAQIPSNTNHNTPHRGTLGVQEEVVRGHVFREVAMSRERLSCAGFRVEFGLLSLGEGPQG